MDRRSFLMTLVGGLAAASLGGIAAVEAAQPARPAKREGTPSEEPEAVTAEMREALDKADAEFSQYYYYRRPRYRYYRRPYYLPRYYYRPRYYHRPRYYYRRRYW